MFWYLPGWLNSFKKEYLLVILAYALAFALVESIATLGAIVLLVVLLPTRLFKGKFVAQGSAIACFLSSLALLFHRQPSRDNNLMMYLELWQFAVFLAALLAIIVVMVFVLSYLLERFSVLGKVINGIADRMMIFLYLYIPLGILSLIVIIGRNIW